MSPGTLGRKKVTEKKSFYLALGTFMSMQKTLKGIEGKLFLDLMCNGIWKKKARNIFVQSLQIHSFENFALIYNFNVAMLKLLDFTAQVHNNDSYMLKGH